MHPSVRTRMLKWGQYVCVHRVHDDEIAENFVQIIINLM